MGSEMCIRDSKEVLSLAQKNDEPGVVRYCLNGACGRGAHAGRIIRRIEGIDFLVLVDVHINTVVIACYVQTHVC